MVSLALVCGYDNSIECCICEKGMDEVNLSILQSGTVKKIVCNECIFEAVQLAELRTVGVF